MIDVMKRINTVPFGLHIHLIFVNVTIMSTGFIRNLRCCV